MASNSLKGPLISDVVKNDIPSMIFTYCAHSLDYLLTLFDKKKILLFSFIVNSWIEHNKKRQQTCVTSPLPIHTIIIHT